MNQDPQLESSAPPKKHRLLNMGGGLPAQSVGDRMMELHDSVLLTILSYMDADARWSAARTCKRLLALCASVESLDLAASTSTSALGACFRLGGPSLVELTSSRWCGINLVSPVCAPPPPPKPLPHPTRFACRGMSYV